MKTKAEVLQTEPDEAPGYWVYTCIKMGDYYKRMDKSRIFCSDKDEVSDAVWNLLHKKVCPECGHVFAGKGWDGIDTHWKAEHEHIMPYNHAWPMIQDDSYTRLMLDTAE